MYDTNNGRPNHFIQVKMTGGSVITDLHIQNWPAHGFSLNSCSDLTIQNIVMDNSAGDAPNNRSNGLAAAHNSDGVGVGTQSKNIVLKNITVHNQDDCVAVTSANNVTVSNMYCYGSHGLSIGSIGGKTYNNVTNILVRFLYIP
jgi:polygalacturonase